MTEVRGQRSDASRNALLVFIIAAAVSFSACANVAEGTKSSVAEKKDPNVAAGKIPVTTASDEARKEFQQGRDLNDKLLVTDSLAHFDKAISLDPNFAWAELMRSGASPTGKEFFDHLKKAV